MIFPLEQQKALLIQFWKQFANPSTTRKGDGIRGEALSLSASLSFITPEETKKRLKVLKWYSDIIIKINTDKSKKRKQFIESREEFIDLNDKLHSKCFACIKPSNCRHHIIQIQHGGLNSHKNLICLCNQCHAEIHPWLK
jgi:hypothetical protein